jgi:hypothetical protein
MTAAASFYISGGTLPADALSYVERACSLAPLVVLDRDLLAALQAGEYCYVLNSRQMGKSSLCVRTMARLRDEGVRTAFLDLTKFGGRNLTAPAGDGDTGGADRGHAHQPLQYWAAHRGARLRTRGSGAAGVGTVRWERGGSDTVP